MCHVPKMITILGSITQNNHKNKKALAPVEKIKFEINSLKKIKFKMNKKYHIREKTCQM